MWSQVSLRMCEEVYYNFLRNVTLLTISKSFFTYGLNTGGPGVMTIGFIIVSLLSKFRNRSYPIHPSNQPALIPCSYCRRHKYGRDPFLHSNLRRSILLGLHACASSARSILRLDHWMVSKQYGKKLRVLSKADQCPNPTSGTTYSAR